jgi:glycosyltransferase involved in cell wall biosynthesis
LNVSFLVRRLDVGGAERQLLGLARGLAVAGHDVTILTFYDGGGLMPLAERYGVHVHSLGKSGRWDIGFPYRLARALRRRGGDVVYSFLPTSNALAAALLVGARRPALVWGIRASNMQGASYDWLGTLMGRVEAWLARLPDRVIANSRAGLDYHLGRGFPPDRMRLVRNAMEPGAYRRDPAQRERLRSEWGVPAGAWVVGCVARLDPMKGQEVLMRAIADPRLRHATVLVIIGPGTDSQRARLRACAAELGLGDAVRFLPAVEDSAPLYSAFDVTCVASLYGEGVSNVLCESMLCGCPCVTTDVGDSAELVGDPRQVVVPGDAAALAGAIAGCVERLGHVDREALRARIASLTDPGQVLSATETVLKEAIGHAATGR